MTPECLKLAIHYQDERANLRKDDFDVVLMYKNDGQATPVMSMSFSMCGNIFCSYEYRIDKPQYENFKNEQGLFVPFEGFLVEMSELLQSCKNEDAKISFPRMITKICNDSCSSSIYLQIIEENKFKQITQISIPLYKTPKKELKEKVLANLHVLKTEKVNLQHHVKEAEMETSFWKKSAENYKKELENTKQQQKRIESDALVISNENQKLTSDNSLFQNEIEKYEVKLSKKTMDLEMLQRTSLEQELEIKNLKEKLKWNQQTSHTELQTFQEKIRFEKNEQEKEIQTLKKQNIKLLEDLKERKKLSIKENAEMRSYFENNYESLRKRFMHENRRLAAKLEENEKKTIESHKELNASRETIIKLKEVKKNSETSNQKLIFDCKQLTLKLGESERKLIETRTELNFNRSTKAKLNELKLLLKQNGVEQDQLSRRLDDVALEKGQLEKEYMKAKEYIGKMELLTKRSNDEISKANSIIKKLQSEIRTYSNKVRLRDVLTSQQDNSFKQVVQEKELLKHKNSEMEHDLKFALKKLKDNQMQALEGPSEPRKSLNQHQDFKENFNNVPYLK